MSTGCGTGCPNIFGKRVSDKTVEYTGMSIPGLGICQGDTLYDIEAIILQAIVNYSTGVGIEISNIDYGTCGLFTQFVTCCNGGDSPKALNDLISNIFIALCTLYGDITTIETEIASLLTPNLNIGCLTGVTSSSSLTAVLQELLLEFCTLKTAFNTLSNTVSNLSGSLSTTIGSFLLSAFTTQQSYTTEVIKTGTGASASIQLQGFVPIGSFFPYNGPLNVFDPTGLGYPGTSAYGFALCNGNHNTLPMSGLIPIATTSTGMGTPPVTIPAGISFPVNSNGGVYEVKLTSAQIPATSVNISDPGHAHPVGAELVNANGAVRDNVFTNPGTSTSSTFSATTGITASVAGGGGVHLNIQPYVAVYYIQRVI